MPIKKIFFAITFWLKKKKILFFWRFYLLPLFFTLSAGYFWQIYREGSCWWWIAAVIFILALNYFLFFKNTTLEDVLRVRKFRLLIARKRV